MSNEEITAEDMAEDAEMKLIGMESDSHNGEPNVVSMMQDVWRHVALMWRTIGDMGGEQGSKLNVDDIFMTVSLSLAEKVLAGNANDEEMKTLALAIKVSVEKTREYYDQEEDDDEGDDEEEASS